MASLKELERDGVRQIRELNENYLKKGEGSELVRKFLESAHQDERLLLRFLQGRKLDADYAWRTLKRYAEVKFDLYPELFPKEYSENIKNFLGNSEIAGLLKASDKLGRKVEVFDIGTWDPDKYSMDEISTVVFKLCESTYLDEEFAYNGTIYIFQCDGIRPRHLTQLTPRNFRRAIDILLRALPIRMKGAYAVNAPYIVTGVVKFIKALLPKKLKNRIIVTSGDLSGSKELMDLIDLEQMPKRFGGPLEFKDATVDLMPLLLK